MDAAVNATATKKKERKNSYINSAETNTFKLLLFFRPLVSLISPPLVLPVRTQEANNSFPAIFHSERPFHGEIEGYTLIHLTIQQRTILYLLVSLIRAVNLRHQIICQLFGDYVGYHTAPDAVAYPAPEERRDRRDPLLSLLYDCSSVSWNC